MKSTNCKICGKKTPNPTYCSRKCSCIAGNLIRWKDHKRTIKICKNCGSNIDIRSKWNLCQKCHASQNYERCKNITIRELKRKASNRKNGRWYSSEIRNFARSWNKDLLTKPCRCGFSHHVEICHIKPIKTFPDGARMSEVNRRNNLIQLCPNCHWLLDNEFLQL